MSTKSLDDLLLGFNLLQHICNSVNRTGVPCLRAEVSERVNHLTEEDFAAAF